MEYLIGPLAGVLTIPLIYALAASPAFALFLVLLSLDLGAVGLAAGAISLGGIDISVRDVVYAALFFALLVRLLHRGRLSPMELAWLIVGVLGVVAFVRGLDLYGLALAGDVRPTFYFTTAILYFMSVPVDRRFLNRVAILWMANGLFLALLALFLIATEGFIAFANEGSDLSRRVLHAAFAFQILQAAIISLYLWNVPQQVSGWRYLGLFLVPVIVLMQYRSVWVTAIFVVFFIALYEKRIRGRLFLALSILLLPATIVTMALYARALDPLAGTFATVTGEAFSANSTFVWRLMGWQALWDAYTFDLDSLIGLPAGAGRSRVHENFIFAHMHSQYLLFLLNNGIMGFVVLIGTYCVAIRRLRRFPAQQAGEILSGRLLLVLLAGQLVFFIPYNVSYEQFALLGIAIGFLKGHGALAGQPARTHGTGMLPSVARPAMAGMREL